MNKTLPDKSLNERIINGYLSQLGYSKEAIKIFSALTENGPLTLQKVAKNSGIERTRLYRIVDEYIEKGLIEEVPVYKRKTIKAVDLEAIELMVKQQQSKAQMLSENLNIFSQAVKSLSQKGQQKVNVVYYRGVEGLKQMTWNVTNAKEVWRTYSYRFWNDIFGDRFTTKINRELIEKKLKVRDLYSDQYIEYKKRWMQEKGKKPEGDWSFWNARYIPEKIVKINQNVDIYNDTVAYGYWDDDDIFGVEIQNQRIADMQKQIFDVLWVMGKKVNTFDWANPVWKK